MKEIFYRIWHRLNKWFSPDPAMVFPEWFFDQTGIDIGKVLDPPTRLHVVGVVQPMRQCTYLGDIYDDDDWSSMLALPLLARFEGQRVEVTVRVVLEGDKCSKE